MLRRTFALIAALAVAFALAAPGARAADDDLAEPSPTPSPPPPLLEQRGLVVTQQQALERIAFRPFMPVPRPLEVALIAPFHNTRANTENPRAYGVGFEYEQNKRKYVLRQWPKAGAGLSTYTQLAGEPHCPDSYLIDGGARDVRGVGWETPLFIFALQPDDGLTPVRDRGVSLKAEWHRLVLRGACR
jgi:hypothetical protein